MKLLAPDDTLDDLGQGDQTSFWRVGRHAELECLSATFRTHVFPPHTHESYVIGAVVGEFVAADRGLGYLITSSSAFFRTPLAFGAVVMLSIMGIVLFQLVVIVERFCFPWAVPDSRSS